MKHIQIEHPVFGRSVRMAYREAGRGRQPPVLLLHGYTGGSWYWDAALSHFGASRRVVALDWTGHGESDKPEDAPYSIDAYCRELGAFAAALGINEAVLCGHSMGGMVALAFALDHSLDSASKSAPDRAAAGDGLRVLGLVLCATAARLVLPPAALRVVHAYESARARAPRWFRRWIAARAFDSAFAESHPEAVDQGLRWIEVVPLAVRQRLFRALVTGYDVKRRLTEIRVPTLVLAGSNDRMLRGSYSLARHIPGARLVRYAATGHMVPVERATEMNREVEAFLAALPRHRGK